METQSHDSNSNGDENLRLHKLNDHCLLKIFKYLLVEDAKNLGKVSKRLKNLSLFKYHKFTFEFRSDMLSKTNGRGIKVLDVILLEYGEHIRSWTLTILNRHRNDAIEVIQKVSQYCTNFKGLQFKCITNMDFLDCPEVLKYLPTVERLSFSYCREINAEGFLQHFRNVKQLHFEGCGATNDTLQILIKNNQEIESYHFNGDDSFLRDNLHNETFINDFSLCNFGSKFQKFCLSNAATEGGRDFANFQMDKTIKMRRLANTNLTKLKLDLPSLENLDKFLITLAKRGTLKELELIKVTLSTNAFETVVQSFQSLQLLVLCPTLPMSARMVASTWSEIWPMHLTKFKTDIPFDIYSVSSMINKLEYLTQLHLDYLKNDPLQEITLKQILKNTLKKKRSRGTLKLVFGDNAFVADYSSNHKFVYCEPKVKRDAIQIDDFPITTNANDRRTLTKSFAY